MVEMTAMRDNPGRLARDGWQSYEAHVLTELKRLRSWNLDIQKDLTQVKVEIAMLKVKSGIWGLLGGMVPVLILVAVSVLKRGF